MARYGGESDIIAAAVCFAIGRERKHKHIVRAGAGNHELIANDHKAKPFVEPPRCGAAIAPQHMRPGLSHLLDAVLQHLRPDATSVNGWRSGHTS